MAGFETLFAAMAPKKMPEINLSPGPGIPLASMVDRLNPNALAMQQQFSQVPWYAVPGMFKGGPIGFNQMPAPPPAPPATPAAAAAAQPPGQTPEEVLRMLAAMGMGANSESGGGSGGGGTDGG